MKKIETTWMSKFPTGEFALMIGSLERGQKSESEKENEVRQCDIEHFQEGSVCIDDRQSRERPDFQPGVQ